MRHLYKNDIIRISKDINTIKCFGVYFLIHRNDIIYVGYSCSPLKRLLQHKFNFDKYHILYFDNQSEAQKMEIEYIKTLKPIYNIAHNDEAPKILQREQDKILKEIDTEKTTFSFNIPNNSYSKKNGLYYFKIDGVIYKIKTTNKYFYFQDRKYLHPEKIFGSILDLMIPS
jgi:hypothetical protein